MSSFTMELGTSGFYLDVTIDDSAEDFIASYHGHFRKKGEDAKYWTLYWEVVNIPAGIEKIGNISFALDVDDSTEPFTSLYDIRRGSYRNQVAKAMNVSPYDTHHNLLVLNGLISENNKPIDDNIIALALKDIERSQTMDVGLTGFFTDTHDHESQMFISFLLKNRFQKLNYDGFVNQDAVMFFRPQATLLK